METKKMSLATVAGKLSRAEMKNVMAGSSFDDSVGDGTHECKDTCAFNRDCPQDRYCGSGVCGGVNVKSCFKYP